MRLGMPSRATCVNLLFCFCICGNSIVLLWNSFLRSFIANTYKLDTAFVYAVVVLLAIRALPIILKRITLRDLAIGAGLVLLFSLSLVSKYYDSDVTAGILQTMFLQAIPAYLVAAAVQNYQQLKRQLHFVAYFIIVAQALCLFVFKTTSTDMDAYSVSYSQYLGYSLMPAGIILGIGMGKKIRLMDFIMFVISLVLIFMAGARTPILVPVLSFILALFYYARYSIWKCVLLSSLVLGGALLLVFAKEIIMLLEPLLSKLGSSERLILMFTNKISSVDSERSRIYKTATEFIMEHPILGCGIGNDRTIIWSGVSGHGSPTGYYTHNLFLEILMQFGIPLGLAVLGGITLTMIRAWRQRKAERESILLFFCLSIIPLMVSRSYLTYVPFYLFTGFIQKRYKREIK